MTEIIARKEAIALGHLHYFTGVACKRGHVAARLVVNRWCTACALERGRHVDQKTKASTRNKSRYLKEGERIKARNLKWNKENQDKMRQIQREWRKDNPEWARQLGRDWRAENADKQKAKAKEWWANNPHKRRIYNTIRRTRKNGATGTHTAEDITDILKLQKGKCACCRVRLGKKFHADHIIPLSKGGSNDRKNIQITCRKCNLSKGPKHPLEFMQSRGMLL